jgi:uncharacterized protein Yka (UPF0111/DUF47 family)
MGPAYNAVSDSETRADLEHYIRMAQNILDNACEYVGRRIVNPIRERPSESEEEYVDKLMWAASELATAIKELSTWLHASMARHPGVVGGKKGNERVPRRPRK